MNFQAMLKSARKWYTFADQEGRRLSRQAAATAERQQVEQSPQGEVNKVERFCERFGDQLRMIHGFNAARTVELAKKMAASNPGFKAEDLIGKDAAMKVG
jgi:hypothetical protein